MTLRRFQGGRCPPWIRFRFRRNRKRYPPLVRTADEAAPPRRGQWYKSPAELDFYREFYAAHCGAPVLPVSACAEMRQEISNAIPCLLARNGVFFSFPLSPYKICETRMAQSMMGILNAMKVGMQVSRMWSC